MGDDYQYDSEPTQNTDNTGQTQTEYAPSAQGSTGAPDVQSGIKPNSYSGVIGTNPGWSPHQQLMAAKLGIDLKDPASSGQSPDMFKGGYGTTGSQGLNLKSEDNAGVGGYLKSAGDAVTGTLKQAKDGISSYYEHMGEDASRAMQANVYGARTPEQLAEATKFPPASGNQDARNLETQGGDQGESPVRRNYPKPLFDSPGWTEGEREWNSRLQHAFRGNFADALAPSMSERFKPGFDPSSIPPSDNPLSTPGMGFVLNKLGIVGLSPFIVMGKAEDFLEQVMGKQIWPRQDPGLRDKWWVENTD